MLVINFLMTPSPQSHTIGEKMDITASYTCCHADVCSSYRSGLSEGVFISKGNILFF